MSTINPLYNESPRKLWAMLAFIEDLAAILVMVIAATTYSLPIAAIAAVMVLIDIICIGLWVKLNICF